MQVTDMEERIVRLEEQTAANHKQNRDSIHDLRNGQQMMTDTLRRLTEVMDKISGGVTALKWIGAVLTLTVGVVGLLVGHIK
jgi:hypothetical protein